MGTAARTGDRHRLPLDANHLPAVTRSNGCSATARQRGAERPSAPSKPSGPNSDTSLRSSRQPIAVTASGPPVMFQAAWDSVLIPLRRPGGALQCATGSPQLRADPVAPAPRMLGVRTLPRMVVAVDCVPPPARNAAPQPAAPFGMALVLGCPATRCGFGGTDVRRENAP